MHIRQKTLVLILSRARRKTVLKMAAAAANLANLSPRQRFATKTLFFLRAYPRSPKSPLAVRVFAFCTPMDCGGRTDGGRDGRAAVIGQGRDELTFAEFGGGRDGRREIPAESAPPPECHRGEPRTVFTSDCDRSSGDQDVSRSRPGLWLTQPSAHS